MKDNHSNSDIHNQYGRSTKTVWHIRQFIIKQYIVYFCVKNVHLYGNMFNRFLLESIVIYLHSLHMNVKEIYFFKKLKSYSVLFVLKVAVREDL